MFKRLLPFAALAAAVLAAAPSGVLAQAEAAAQPPAQGKAVAPSQAQPERDSSVPEPRVRRTVIEDDGSRISELRVRGAVRSITVRPKGAIDAEYEVLAPDAGRDTSSGPNSSKGAAGQRVWRVLSF